MRDEKTHKNACTNFLQNMWHSHTWDRVESSQNWKFIPFQFSSEFFTTFNIRNTFNQKSLIQSSIQTSSSFAYSRWDSLSIFWFELRHSPKPGEHTECSHKEKSLSFKIEHTHQTPEISYKVSKSISKDTWIFHHLVFAQSLLTEFCILYISFPIMNFVYIFWV